MAPEDADLETALADLVRLELVQRKQIYPEPVYAFNHILIQQSAYQGLLLKTRAELHRRIGGALEASVGGRTDDVLEELAGHFSRSSDRAKAVHYLVRAGDRAAKLFAHHEAEAHFRRALELVATESGAGERSVVLEKLGDSLVARGELAGALAAWREVIADGAAGARRLAALHRKVGAARFASGERESALEHFQRGLAALGETTDDIEAARLYQELGRVSFRLGDQPAAIVWAERALSLGVRLGAADVVSHAHNTLGVALARAGDVEKGVEEVRRSLEAALAAGLGSVACRAYTNLAVMTSALDPLRSAEYCRAGVALAERIGDRLQQSWLYCALAGGHCTLSGDYDEGVKAAEAAVALDERLGQRNHLPIPLILLAQIHGCRGDAAESERHYRRALAVAEQLGEPQMLVPCYEGLATIAIENGRDAEADEWVTKSREVQAATDSATDSFLLLPFLC